MKNNRKGDALKQGYYLDLANGEFVHLDGTNAILAPYTRGKLIKVPTIGVMLGAPIIGFAYVMFLPLAGIAGMIAWLGRKVGQLVAAAFHPKHENA